VQPSLSPDEGLLPQYVENQRRAIVKKTALSAIVLSAMVVLLSGASGDRASYGSFEKWGKKYYQAESISIYDPRMGIFGSVEGDKALMHINLVDIGKFSGHLCAGATSGFMITKLALQNLYARGEIPVRGDILLTTSSIAEPMEIAAYILGILEKEHHGFTRWVIDKSIVSQEGCLGFIFERISTGKKVKIVWNKAKTLKEHTGDVRSFKKLKMKTVHYFADDAEAKRFGRLVNSLVMKIIRGEIKYEVKVLAQGSAQPAQVNKKGCRCHDFAS
jgi:hypothetical protein